jgi:molecular chaperone GrpE
MTPHAGPSGGARVPGGSRPGNPGAPPRTEKPVDPRPVDQRTDPVLDDSVDEARGDSGAGSAGDANDTVEHDIDDLLVAARRERDEYREMTQRVQADFENYKKRMLRQQTDHLERAAEDLVTKVLPVLDAFDLARAHLGAGEDLSTEGKALVAGSTLLADILAREGLERIGAVGEPFDPTTHDAVEHVPAGAGEDANAGDAAPEGPVVDEVLRAGYRWKGRVIRPALVRVRG